MLQKLLMVKKRETMKARNLCLWCLWHCSLAAHYADTIEIIMPEPQRWHEYKALRLRALAEQPHAFGMSVDDEQNRPDDYWKDLLDEAYECKNRWIVCAQRDGQLIGMAGAVREWDTYSYVHHMVTIVNVYVAPEARGQKIAQRLIKELCMLLEQDATVEQALLWVTVTQKDAVTLYERCGFEISGILSRAIKIDDIYYDNYLMERSVKCCI